MLVKISRTVLIVGVLLLLLSVSFTPNTQAAPQNSIARMWEGRTTHAKADAYERYLRDNGAPFMTSQKGNLGMQILRRQTSDAVEFIIITYWDSRDSIKKVVGEDIERAWSLPRDKEFLIEPVTTVRHYQIAYSK